MRHEFVDSIPEQLAEGVLYISLAYATVLHNCACGCGQEVVTPLTPHDWNMRYDGETISLDPSIGNWSLPCRSHYWIKKGRVVWAGAMSDVKIAEGRASDRHNKENWYGQPPRTAVEVPSVPSIPATPLQRLKRWFLG